MKSSLIALRVISLLIFIFILFQPVVKLIEKKKPTVIVLVDTSLSMSIKTKETRFDLLKKFIESEVFKKFIKRNNVVFYSFSDSINKSSLENILNITLNGNTDIGKAVKETIEKEKEIDAILVLTDGANTFPINIEEILSFHIPVHILLVKDKEKIKDVGIKEIKISDILFTNIPISIDILISSYGIKGSIPIILKEKGKILKKEMIKIDEEEKEVKFKFTPYKTGRTFLTFEIPYEKNEINYENNIKVIPVNILKEKIRILSISGRPNWEYKFLRNTLKNNPSIDLVSFIILRNPDSILAFPDSECTLIPFPASEIFAKDIFNFDIIIFDNFNFAPYLSIGALENIKKFVSQGGGLLMIGGEQSFKLGGYDSTPIGEILPVSLLDNEKFINAPFRLHIEEINHPILLLSEDINENRKLWNEMPNLVGYNTVGRKKEATVLISHQGIPIVAVRNYGKGRIATISSPSTWRWNNSKYSKYYQKFWRNIIDWLIQSPDIKQVKFLIENKNINLGENVNIKVRVLDETYKPVKNAIVKIIIHQPDGKSNEHFLQESNNLGIYELSNVFTSYGIYSLEAIGYSKGKVIGKDYENIEVKYPYLEMSNILPNEELLKELAFATSGKFDIIDNVTDISIKKKDEIVKIKEIWHKWWILLILIFFLCLSWKK